MFKFAAIRTTIVLTLLVSLVGSWHITQVAAWAMMVHERAPEIGLLDAICSVTTGQAPCNRCASIAEERDQERDSPSSIIESAGKVVLATVSISRLTALRPIVLMELRPLLYELGPEFEHEVPSPPPRA